MDWPAFQISALSLFGPLDLQTQSHFRHRHPPLLCWKDSEGPESGQWGNSAWISANADASSSWRSNSDNWVLTSIFFLIISQNSTSSGPRALFLFLLCIRWLQHRLNCNRPWTWLLGTTHPTWFNDCPHYLLSTVPLDNLLHLRTPIYGLHSPASGVSLHAAVSPWRQRQGTWFQTVWLTSPLSDLYDALGKARRRKGPCFLIP